jgi:hypothetical protein
LERDGRWRAEKRSRPNRPRCAGKPGMDHRQMGTITNVVDTLMRT